MSYRDDPAWIEARKQYVAEMAHGETAIHAYMRRLNAAHEMHAIESADEVAA